MGWANGAHAPPVKDRAAAARLASSVSGRLRDMPRRTQGECGSRSRRPGRRFSRDEDAASRTRQWPIPGLWEWRRARSASANKRRCGARDGPGWRAPNGNWCDRRRAASYFALFLAHGAPLVGAAAIDGALDLEQRIDASDRLQRDRRDRFALLAFPSILLDVSQLEEAPPRMGKAKRRRNRPHRLLWVEQRLEAVVAIGLQDTGEGGQMLLRMLA